jgi:hypothetical protein
VVPEGIEISIELVEAFIPSPSREFLLKWIKWWSRLEIPPIPARILSPKPRFDAERNSALSLWLIGMATLFLVIATLDGLPLTSLGQNRPNVFAEVIAV